MFLLFFPYLLFFYIINLLIAHSLLNINIISDILINVIGVSFGAYCASKAIFTLERKERENEKENNCLKETRNLILVCNYNLRISTWIYKILFVYKQFAGGVEAKLLDINSGVVLEIIGDYKNKSNRDLLAKVSNCLTNIIFCVQKINEDLKLINEITEDNKGTDQDVAEQTQIFNELKEISNRKEKTQEDEKKIKELIEKSNNSKAKAIKARLGLLERALENNRETYLDYIKHTYLIFNYLREVERNMSGKSFLNLPSETESDVKEILSLKQKNK